MKHSVVCTGLGIVSSLGKNTDDVFTKIFDGRSGIRLLSSAESNGQPTVAGVVDFDPSPWFTKFQLSGVDRVSQLAVAATQIAMDDSNLKVSSPTKLGCYFGTGMGGAGSLEVAYASHFSSNPRLSPLSVVSSMTNAANAQVGMRFDAQGPVMNYSIACASSAAAIGEAYLAIQTGRIDYAIVGGAESLLVPGVIRAWQAMRTLATPDTELPESSCRPFSMDRSGLVLGEGAAALILERSDLAINRNAKIYANILGYGISCDASHIAKPNSRGQIQAIQMALESAGLQPQDIGYINTHGTATKVGDTVECESIQHVWQGNMNHLKMSSTKSAHGHLLGAAGALEAAITILSLVKQKIPPTAFCPSPDPEINVPHVIGKGIEAPNLKYALSNSFAFGGTNVVLAFGRN